MTKTEEAIAQWLKSQGVVDAEFCEVGCMEHGGVVSVTAIIESIPPKPGGS